MSDSEHHELQFTTLELLLALVVGSIVLPVLVALSFAIYRVASYHLGDYVDNAICIDRLVAHRYDRNFAWNACSEVRKD